MAVSRKIQIPHGIFTVQSECSVLTHEQLGRECHSIAKDPLAKDHRSNRATVSAADNLH